MANRLLSDNTIATIKNLAKEFEEDLNHKKKIEEAWKIYKEFINKFPYKDKPEKIDELKPEDLYNPGKRNYFFHYIEHRLKDLGHLRIGSALIWQKAVENIEIFKNLLKIAVGNKSLAEKVDANWEAIPFWGGDKIVAKKIIFLYDPQSIVPVFKNDHLKHFLKKLNVSSNIIEAKAMEDFDSPLSGLTLGKEYELLNTLLLEIKNSVEPIRNWDNAYFTRFLYKYFPPPRPQEETVKPGLIPLSKIKLLYSPTNELGVVLLFGMYHEELGSPYIVKISDKFPDAIVIDKSGNIRMIEFEYLASNFRDHRHPPDQCDYIICWINNLPEDDELREKVISIKEFIEKYGEK